jgi:uncharacterized coiled-coil protein SlyX
MRVNLTLSIIVLFILTTISPVLRAEQTVTMEELRALLKERDAAIIKLQNQLRALMTRMEELEEDRGSSVSVRPLVASQSVVDETASEAGATTDTADFGRFAVDELAAERALERSLAQAGALLLPAWRMELTPSLGYAIDDFGFTTDVDPEGPLQVEREVYTMDLDLRVGLPFDAQLELGLPYASAEETISGLSSNPPDSEALSRSGSGLGSLRLGLAKRFLRERGWRPDLIGRLTWNTGTGDRTDNDVLIGGFESIEASIAAIKRSDPVVFVGSLNYETFSKEDGVEPGDLFSFSLGTALAVSPSSSLSASISNRFAADTRLAGRRVSGSDFTSVLLNLGVSTIIARDVLLGVSTGIGVSTDAPDYAIGLSATFRSNALLNLVR